MGQAAPLQPASNADWGFEITPGDSAAMMKLPYAYDRLSASKNALNKERIEDCPVVICWEVKKSWDTSSLKLLVVRPHPTIWQVLCY